MNKHQIYVPDHLVDGARDIAIDQTGGATLSPGHTGYWLSPSGDLIVDRITLLTVFEDTGTTRDEIIDLLLRGGEESVAYETNGVPHLIDRPQEVAA